MEQTQCSEMEFKLQMPGSNSEVSIWKIQNMAHVWDQEFCNLLATKIHVRYSEIYSAFPSQTFTPITTEVSRPYCSLLQFHYMHYNGNSVYTKKSYLGSTKLLNAGHDLKNCILCFQSLLLRLRFLTICINLNKICSTRSTGWGSVGDDHNGYHNHKNI
jgi:hypothetical protein